jgi:N-acetyl-anhydromuramyl-L-alanine amidase AmpD
MQIDKSRKFSDFFEKRNEPRKIDFIVLHHVQADSADHAIEQFKQHKVSPHFLIDEAGKIFELVDENDMAYHAGVSFWRGVESLNASSIGIEFVNSSPFEKKFSETQMKSGLELCQHFIKKHKIPLTNVVGHSDIAYYPVPYPSPAPGEDEGFAPAGEEEEIDEEKEKERQRIAEHANLLDRKQDPSHLFDWKFLSHNGVGIYHNVLLPATNDKLLFKLNDKNPAIKIIKQKMAKFGYRVVNSNEEFDREMLHLARVFNRHFNSEKFKEGFDAWYLSSQMKLDEMSIYLSQLNLGTGSST